MYSSYRLGPSSEDWSLELVLLDSEVCPVTINLRMDVVFKALDPWLSSDDYKTPDNTEGNVNEAVSRAKTDVTGPSKSAKDKAVESSSLSITDLVRRVNLQVHIKRILVISWQSSTDCNGFAFMQQRLDLQLRLIREKHGKTGVPLSLGYTSLRTPEKDRKGTSSAPYTSKIALTTTTTTGSRSPLLVDHMFCEAEFADLYVRDWSHLIVGGKADGTASRRRGSSSGLDQRRRSRQPSVSMEGFSTFYSRVSQYRSWHDEKRAEVRRKASEKSKANALKNAATEEPSSNTKSTTTLPFAADRMGSGSEMTFMARLFEGAREKGAPNASRYNRESRFLTLDINDDRSLVTPRTDDNKEERAKSTPFITYHGVVLVPPSRPFHMPYIDMDGTSRRRYRYNSFPKAVLAPRWAVTASLRRCSPSLSSTTRLLRKRSYRAPQLAGCRGSA